MQPNFFDTEESLVYMALHVGSCVICHKVTKYKEYSYNAYVCCMQCLDKLEQETSKAQEEI